MCKSGATVPKLTNDIKALPGDQNYKRVILLAGGGGGDICEKEPDDVVESYREMVKAAKEISSNVTVSSVPPRLKPTSFMEKVSSLNAGLHVLSGEENCTSIDLQDTFYLRSGEANEGFLDDDYVNPNIRGTNRIAKALELTSKNKEKYDVASRKRHNTLKWSKSAQRKNDENDAINDDNNSFESHPDLRSTFEQCRL